MKLRYPLVGTALLVAFASEALTLGSVRGAAFIGQPLDLVVQVQMDPGEEASSLCFDAEVFHADTRQVASRVRVLVDAAAAQAPLAQVRVLSSAPVDEPVVTLMLQTKCGQKASRRYVLLADLPNEVAAPLSVTAASSALDLKASAAALGAASKSPADTPVPTATPAPVTLVNQPPAPQPAFQKIVIPSRPAATSSPAAKPRLQLAPITLLASPEAAPPVAAASDVALPDMHKVQALEDEVKTLLALATKNEAMLVEMKARLLKAETEQSDKGLVYGLSFLVLAMSIAMALLWRRQRQHQPDLNDGWHDALAQHSAQQVQPDVAPAHQPAPEPVAKAEALVASSAVRPPAAPGGNNGLTDWHESRYDTLMGIDPRLRAMGLDAAPVIGPQVLLHAFNSEAVLEARLQAEFFVSLGQPDQSVRILVAHIRESNEPNPLIYLDLLSLCHNLQLNTEFNQFRQEFTPLFNAMVPAFASFEDEGRDLEGYPAVLSSITAQWPRPQVLGVIEKYLFRAAGNAAQAPFDLAAFRDLLLLHTVAHNLAVDALPEVLTGQAGLLSAPVLAGYDKPVLWLDDVHQPAMLDLDLDLDLSGRPVDDAQLPTSGSSPFALRAGEQDSRNLAARASAITSETTSATGRLRKQDLPDAPN